MRGKRARVSTGCLYAVLGTVLAMLSACRLQTPTTQYPDDLAHFREMAKLDAVGEGASIAEDPFGTDTPPLSLSTTKPEQYRYMTLDEVMQTALTNSRVFLDLGGTVLQAPGLARTILDPALTETDPRFGVEAALSAFDAQLAMTGLFQKNDRAVNNELITGGARQFQQDLDIFQTQISKQAATGSEFAFRHNATYDANNAAANLFSSAWDTNFEAEFRQPLGQGRGVDFNRIAGPQATPGVANGVVIARINTDISLADFELGLRNLVNNVENAYWELYFAYRDLEVAKQARDRALESWRAISAQAKSGVVGQNLEARAREQYYRFEESVQNALSGRLVASSAGNSGLSVGFSNTAAGIYVAERRLRLLMGLPANDGTLICPTQDPPLAKVIFNWDEVSREALVRRAELARQRIQINRRELELVAARNFLLPQLDAFGLYRFRGFGHDLISANRDAKPEFDNAFMELTEGDYQEWQLGVELRMPVGFRQAYAGVRNAQLFLARDRAVLEEQERIIISDLSNAIAELDRSYSVAQTVLNRRLAAEQELAILVQRAEREDIDENLILDAQRRKADADSGYYRALVDYATAIKNVHFAKGTLMEYNGIYLAEGPWPDSYASKYSPLLKPSMKVAADHKTPSAPPAMSTAPATHSSPPPPRRAAEAAGPNLPAVHTPTGDVSQRPALPPQSPPQSPPRASRYQLPADLPSERPANRTVQFESDDRPAREPAAADPVDPPTAPPPSPGPAERPVIAPPPAAPRPSAPTTQPVIKRLPPVSPG